MTAGAAGGITVSGISVELTNTEKVLYPDSGITKGELAGYYRDMAGRMLPFLRDRPLVMARYPRASPGSGSSRRTSRAFSPAG